MTRPPPRRVAARILGPLFLLVGALAPAAQARPLDDHAEAIGALADTRAAMGEIIQAESTYSTDKQAYRRFAQRAINALSGEHAQYYAAAAGNSGDAEGALGHIDRLLDRKENPPWTTALHGAEANLRAALANLLDAKKAHELMDFQVEASRALGHIDVAIGRPDQTDVFGGLEGALATTALGVPTGAKQADACAAPPANLAEGATLFGTHGGYLAYIAVPATAAAQKLPAPSGATAVSVENGTVVLHTAAALLVAKLCAQRSAAASPIRPAAAVPDPSASSDPGNTNPAAPAGTANENAPHPTAAEAQKAEGAGKAGGGAVPALYTMAQAKAGKQLFGQHCVSCHGENLQGVAAPSVAGKDFLDTAKSDGWTVKIIRYIVFNLMPKNQPGELTPEQDADVMAYLLASNCYPAGNKPFPTEDQPEFADMQMGPVPGAHPNANKYGVCPVK